MKRTYEVVIVGGGAIGASVAWHLANRGCTDVLVIDGNPGDEGGSTARATGGFRAQFATEINVRLSLRSREKLLHFRDDPGADAGFRQCGYLFIASTEESLRVLRAAQRVQLGAGLHEARMVDESEIRQLNPAIGPVEIAGGAFCETDGFLHPLQILRGYASAAERSGVVFAHSSRVRVLRVSGARIASVVTDTGEFGAGTVVNAAGAWAAALAEMAGVELPVTPLRRQVAVTHPTDVLDQSMPMTIFSEDGFHMRVRDGRVLLLQPDVPNSADPFDTSLNEGWIETVRNVARSRIPLLRQVEIDRGRCWAGLYEMSPDEHAIIGRSVEVENFFLANGSSGHGVMHSPAIGEAVAELILDGRASLDLSELRPERFREGRSIRSASLL